MKQIKVIQLNDGSIHETAERADRHLTNLLSRGVNRELFQNLAHKNVMELKNYFVENAGEIEQTLQVVKELNEVLSLTKH